MDEMLLATQEWLNNTYSGRTGYVDVPEDGGEATNSRYLTYRGLVRALQIELGGLTVDGDFGNGTVTRFNTVYPNGLSQVPDVNTASPTNMGYIIQGTLWTKGYEPGGFTGIFGPNTAAAIISFQGDAGIPQNGVVRGYILQGLMNTDDYDYDGPTTGDEYYKHLVQLKLNELYWSQIGLIPPNGLWERKSHQNLIKACQIEWGQTVDGVFGTATMNAAPTLSQNTSGWTASKRLLQMALTVNGYYPGGITGTFGSGTYNAVYNFQAFACLGADGVAGKNTWASLLKSCGNPDRAGATTCDTAVRLTAQQAGYVVSSGYNTVGRYLTNAGDPAQGFLDKKMTAEEIGILADAGLKVFPIYQTRGSSLSYFIPPQGTIDGIAARQAAYRLGFPENTTVIYFAVDYDVRNTEIEDAIIPYFRAVKSQIGSYKVGVYGPRSVCIALDGEEISEASFVSDMSSGFEGNIGYKLPDNWAYDQIAETYVAGYIGVDKCIASSRATAILASQLNPVTEPEYCGGSDYENVTHHTWLMQENGVLKCSVCGYEVASPSLQDSGILEPNDLRKVIALLGSFAYWYSLRNDGNPWMFEITPEQDVGEQFYYMPEKCLRKIDEIRSQDNYKDKYAFKNSDGIYVPEYANRYAILANNSYPDIFCAIDHIVSPLQWVFYSGALEALTEWGVGIFAGATAPVFWAVASIFESILRQDAIGFLGSACDYLEIPYIGDALGLYQVYLDTNMDVEVGDYMVQIMPMYANINAQLHNVLMSDKTIKSMEWQSLVL